MTFLRILVLCTANRCRSQMAEGWLRHFGRDRLEVHSVGTSPKTVHPHAIRAMAQAGVDVSQHASKHLDQYRNQHFDWVITVCDSAKQACPVFPNAARTLHHKFDDPDQPGLSKEQANERFRRVRDAIRDWAKAFVESELEKEDVQSPKTRVE